MYRYYTLRRCFDLRKAKEVYTPPRARSTAVRHEIVLRELIFAEQFLYPFNVVYT